MKKNVFFKIFSIALIFVTLFISCADDGVTAVGGTAYLGVNPNGDSAKSLSAKYDGFDEVYYIWYYKTSTTDSDPGISGTAKPINWTTWSDFATGYAAGVSAYVPAITTSTDGCVGLFGQLPYDYSAGGSMWKLYLQARTTGTDSKVVYEGETDWFKVDANLNDKSVYVPLNYQDIDDGNNNGKLAFNFGEIKKLEDYNTTDSDITWTTECDVYLYSTGLSVTGTDFEKDSELWITGTNLKPDSYVVYAKYKSYGVTYEIADTVNVHSNITATVKGSFEKRITKDIKVFYHDGQIINNDRTTRTNTNVVYSGKDALTTEIYKFEDFLSLPYEKDDDMNACIKDGYTFVGWYTTDTAFGDDNRTTPTAWMTPGYVRTNTDAEGALKQAIFVEVDGVTTKADLDFVLAYTTMTDVEEENWFYEIHLYARWIPNTITAGATTKARDTILLNYTSFSSVNGFNYSNNISINTSQTEIQGFTNYSNIVVYADKYNNLVYLGPKYQENDEEAKNTGSWATNLVEKAVKKFVVVGFYDENGKMVITTEGLLTRKEGSDYLDSEGDGWIHQGATPFESAEVPLYAYWREITL